MERKNMQHLLSSAFFLFAFIVRYTAAGESSFNAFVGTTVALPCTVDTKQCGALHSVKWYRDMSRIYVFSHAGGIARAEGDATDRMTVEYTENSMEARLKISPVEVDDEATYKCEITYLEVRENCDVVQIVKLTTLVKPTSVTIRDNHGTQLVNTSMLGPKDEGTDVEIICEAGGGKPVPMVRWYNQSTELKWATYSQSVDRNGMGTGRSQLKVTLSKGDLGTKFECRVESTALEHPIIAFVVAEVYVRPTKMEVSSVNRNAIAGMKVMLLCDVHGAKPAAEVTWFNGSSAVNTSFYVSDRESNRDGTYTTKSTLEFVASRYENGKTFYCNAENQVTRNNNEPALHGNVLVEIQYPPVVSVSPLNITVNESANPFLGCSYVANPQELQKVIWSRDEKNLSLSDQRYEGGTIRNPPLRIKNVSREDMGYYHCWLENSVNMVKSENSIFLNVMYPPVVTVLMEPAVVKAVDKSTVILECNVTTGNPSNLQKVRWYLGGELMKELPECNYTTYENGTRDSGGPFCVGVDPSILKLESVQENFAGNYTCQGMNAAGWGAESEPQELIVYYPPSAAKLRFFPSRVVKSASVNLECSIDDPGRPENTTFLWYRGSHLIPEITTSNWTISPVTLETRSNFTCIPQNDGGQGKPDTVEINVDAPPSFIQNLIPYQGILYNSKNISLTCRVECWPVCSIVWLIDGKPLDKNTSSLYYVRTEIYPSDVKKNDFESVESTLIWNLTAWPHHQLDKSAPNTNYTCRSYANGVGAGVVSTSEVAVDYAPEEVGIFYQDQTFLAPNHVINVVEGQHLTPVKCVGKGHPTLNFLWRKNDTSEPIKTDTLQLTTLSRYNSGSFICEASNKHGTAAIKTYFNVQYIPECSVTMIQKEGKPTLVCTAMANPQEVSFSWRMEEYNETYVETENIIQDGLNSYLFLDSAADSARTYYCYVNNSVGTSSPCEKSVAGARPWWNTMEDENKIIAIIASSAVLILCVLVICIIIIILCRRKRANTKLPNQSSLADKTGLGTAPPIGGIADPTYDPDKGFYENLPFHSMQNPPNKPISVIAPFNQGQTHNFPKPNPFSHQNSAFKTSTKSMQNLSIKRHQSFSGFPRNLHPISHSNNFLNVSNSQYFRYMQPALSTNNPLQRPYSSQILLNRLPMSNNLHNLPTTLQNQSGNSTISAISIKDHNLNTLGVNSSVTEPRKVSSSFSLQPKNQNDDNPDVKIISKSESDSNSRNLKVKSNKNIEGNVKHFKAKATMKENGTQSDTEVQNKSNDYLKKHKCYSPTFHSLRCKKHSKKRTLVYAVPKRILSDGDLPNCQDSGASDNESFKHYHIVPIPAPRCKKHRRKEIIYQNVAEALRNKSLMDTSNDSSIDLSTGKILDDAATTEVEVHSLPRLKEGQSRDSNKVNSDSPSSKTIDPVVSSPVSTKTLTSPVVTSRVDTRPKLVAVSPKRLNEISVTNSAFKRSPTVKVCPFSKSKNEIQKGALSIQIQAKIKGSSSQNPSPNPSIQSAKSDAGNPKEPFIRKTKDEPKNSPKPNDHSELKSNTKNSPNLPKANGHSEPKSNTKNSPNLPKANDLSEPKSNNKNSPNLPKAKNSPSKTFLSPKTSSQNTSSIASDAEVPKMPLLDTSEKKWSPKSNQSNRQNAFYTLTAPHHKPSNMDLASHYSATIPHPKHSKLIPRALFQEQQLPKSKSFSSKTKQKKHFQIPLQKCHSFKFQTAESYFQPIKNLHEENLMKNGYISDYADSNRVMRPNNKREKHKQKTNGPLVVMRQSDYQDSLHFQENVHGSVHLQYPQPGLNSPLKPQTGRPNGLVYADLDMPKPSKKVSSNNMSKSKQPKHKPKTEYATLQFNDIGQEIDV
ncbi:uncharacterized protein LOC123322654 isoform X3 [Coccinella septempunctata]|uniref:uncharacterized protein LOC123322654 isoform X3 n=1 Tax=Coccinella septempunctata TaxID=41139 RepID=UPI001D07813A|nr:uncharacterized protein LOC123322654 isoform X3 [Coccinella septempunctata]